MSTVGIVNMCSEHMENKKKYIRMILINMFSFKKQFSRHKFNHKNNTSISGLNLEGPTVQVQG